MRRRSFLSSCAATGVFIALDGRAAELSTDTPTATIETLQRGLIAAAGERPTATLEERYGLLEPVILATHDLAYIAEFALRRFTERLKDAVDPNGILSPGRAGIWPAPFRSLRGGMRS